jgi:hypothetical protein
MLTAALVFANVMLLVLVFSLKPLPRHQNGWLHEGTWRLERVGGPAPYTWHLEGVAYDVAPRPPRKHQCQPQTCTITSSLHHKDRCACGASRVGVYGQWLGRNLRWDTPSRG